MAADTYNKVFTMHGVIMVFFFLVPSVPATIGNFIIPIMVGAKDLALPKINLLSWYLYLVGLHGHLHDGRRRRRYGLDVYHSALHALPQYACRLYRAGGLCGRLQLDLYRPELHRHHSQDARPGMTWFRLPLFVWSHYAACILMVLGTPVLAITLVLVVLERTVGIGVFDPAKGGDPILFQHLFWFYSHPAVYIMILPGMGVISEVVSTFSRKRVFGYTAVAFSSVAIAVFGFFVWAHHMFIMGSPITRLSCSRCYHAGRGAFGHQDIQLDIHAVQGLHYL